MTQGSLPSRAWSTHALRGRTHAHPQNSWVEHQPRPFSGCSFLLAAPGSPSVTRCVSLAPLPPAHSVDQPPRSPGTSLETVSGFILTHPIHASILTRSLEAVGGLSRGRATVRTTEAPLLDTWANPHLFSLSLPTSGFGCPLSQGFQGTSPSL